MAKSKTTEAMTYCKVKPLHRRRLDPYNSVYVGVDEDYIVDANFAEFLVDMGEAEILEEGVTPPWEPPPPPPEALVAKTEVKSEVKHAAGASMPPAHKDR
jgi:hypothetical protein